MYSMSGSHSPPAIAVRMLLCAGTVLILAWAQSASAEGRRHTIIIEGMQFTPSALEVKRNDTVEWVNKDFFPHNAIADGGGFTSKEIEPGGTWQWKAATRGSISYSCTLHPSMKAVLTVK
jgi:plastocyanin